MNTNLNQLFIFGMVCIKSNLCRMSVGRPRNPPRRKEEEECDPQRSVVPSPRLRGLSHKGWARVTGQLSCAFSSVLAPAGIPLNL